MQTDGSKAEAEAAAAAVAALARAPSSLARAPSSRAPSIAGSFSTAQRRKKYTPLTQYSKLTRSSVSLVSLITLHEREAQILLVPLVHLNQQIGKPRSLIILAKRIASASEQPCMSYE